jgi:hypothetical protein
MKTKVLALGLAAILALPCLAKATPKGITGDYMEFRSADVYTGPCFANGEMGLDGKNGVLAWHVRQGEWKGVGLDGLSVVAVVRASNTLGDRFASPLPARSVVIVDIRATAAQRAALVNFAKAQAGPLLAHVVAVEAQPIVFQVNEKERGYGTLKAGNLVELKTRAVGPQDLFCHNEEVYYQPLVGHLQHAVPAVELESAYNGNHLDVTWNDSGRRSSFVAGFAAP